MELKEYQEMLVIKKPAVENQKKKKKQRSNQSQETNQRYSVVLNQADMKSSEKAAPKNNTKDQKNSLKYLAQQRKNVKLNYKGEQKSQLRIRLTQQQQQRNLYELRNGVSLSQFAVKVQERNSS